MKVLDFRVKRGREFHDKSCLLLGTARLCYIISKKLLKIIQKEIYDASSIR